MNDQEWKLIDRFKEPSSWAALAAGLAGIGITVPSQWVQVIAGIGSAACVLLGILFKEGK
jgi:hypothetical protein